MSQTTTFAIPAKAWSDDRVIEVQFDAAPWFEKATGKQIRDLIRCGFRGNYAADQVAHDLADEHDGLADLFKYLELANRSPVRHTIGFEVAVDRDAALFWLGVTDEDSAID